MAKEPEEGANVPIYNPDGSILGYTTPEKYAVLEKELGGASTATQYSNPGQTTGYSDDANSLTFWDPNAGTSGDYVTEDMSNASFQEKIAFRDSNNLSYYTNAQGDYVYGVKPTSTYTQPGSDDTTSIEGVDPNWQPYTVPDMSGIGRYGGGQRTPENTSGYSDPFDVWQGSSSHDSEGNIIPGGQADPNSRPVYERGEPYQSTTMQMGSGGVQGIDPGYQSGIQGSDLDRFGYESSTNQDFYQRQFADMRAQAMRNQDREQQARSITPQTQEAGDPWAWANIPDVVEGGAGSDNPNDWVLNPNYDITPGVTTNSQITGQMNDIWNPDELAQWNEHWENPNINADSIFWSSRPKDQIVDTWTSNLNPGTSTEWQDTYNKAINNLFVQAGNAPTPGGMNVPAGYASPSNM